MVKQNFQMFSVHFRYTDGTAIESCSTANPLKVNGQSDFGEDGIN